MPYSPVPVLLALLTGGGLIAGTAAAQPKPAPVSEAGFSACFDAQAKLVPFSGVALAKRGAQSFVRTSGFSDPDETIAVSRDARFRLASVQKVITRVAIGQLAEQGKVKLDAPIGTYLAGLPATHAAITIDQLLQHRSGLAPFTNMRVLPQELRAAYARARNSRERVPILASQPLSFKPGEREEYSNGGYHMLGAIIETVAGKDYAAYLQDALFKPLGMVSTSMIADPRTAVRFSKIATGTPQAEWSAVVSRVDRPGSPAGDGVSTADDLTRLGEALLGDQLLSPAIKARVFPRKGDAWRIGQAGGTIGTNTDFSAYPERGWVVTVLANFDPPAGELMGEVLRTYVLGKGCTPLSPKDRKSPMDALTRRT